MIKTVKKIFVFVLLFVSLHVQAQDGAYEITDDSYTDTSVEMADVMRDNGKIYVVVAVVLILFVGIVLYLVMLDKKISRLEKEMELRPKGEIE